MADVEGHQNVPAIDQPRARKFSRRFRSAKLVLVVMANHADDHGGSCYPGVARVAQQDLPLTKHTRRILHSLIASGVLAVVGNERGGRGASRRYRINVEKLTRNPPTHGSDST